MNLSQKNYLLSLLLFLFYCNISLAQLTIQVNFIPNSTPSDDAIYLVGNFNNWNPADLDFRLTDNGNNTFEITFTPNTNALEFKFTRGSWDTVEGSENGGFRPNRILEYNGNEQTIEYNILSWEDQGASNNTLAANAYILSYDFEIPQLNRTRRLWIYLPPNYESSQNNYPVMYLQDGQNIFDASTSFSGEWEVDESLNILFENGDDGIIIVGIDNGGAHRNDEYSPWPNPEYGGGEGVAYVNFIVHTLKPFIDNNFRTKPDRLNTGIMGSSLGGLISFYAAIEYQEIFGKAGIFSPSFWLSHQVYNLVENTGKEQDMKIYLLAGEKESGSLVQEMVNMQSTLLNAGFQSNEVLLHIDQEGQHSEWFWRQEFPDAYTWLFGDVVNITNSINEKQDIHISPNPATDSLYIKSSISLQNAIAHIYTLDGKLLITQELMESPIINMKGLKNGIFILEIIKDGQMVFVERIVKE